METQTSGCSPNLYNYTLEMRSRFFSLMLNGQNPVKFRQHTHRDVVASGEMISNVSIFLFYRCRINNYIILLQPKIIARAGPANTNDRYRLAVHQRHDDIPRRIRRQRCIAVLGCPRVEILRHCGCGQHHGGNLGVVAALLSSNFFADFATGRPVRVRVSLPHATFSPKYRWRSGPDSSLPSPPPPPKTPWAM